MSIIEGVCRPTAVTLSDQAPTVADVDQAAEVERRPIRELLDDQLLDELLAWSRDAAGGLRLTGEGSMLGELVKAVLERACQSPRTVETVLCHNGPEQGR